MDSQILLNVDWDILLDREKTYFENEGLLFAGFIGNTPFTKIAFLPGLNTSVQDLNLMGFEVIPVTL